MEPVLVVEELVVVPPAAAQLDASKRDPRVATRVRPRAESNPRPDVPTYELTDAPSNDSGSKTAGGARFR